MDTLNVVLPQLIHLGALLYMVCFLFRNQIMLRLFAIGGDFAYIAYFFTAAERPLWEAIAWASANVAINGIMIGLVLRDQHATHMTDRELQLFRTFSCLTPGEFRRLMKLATWTEVETDQHLTREGSELNNLYYFYEGTVVIEKSGRQIHPKPVLFIGELAFLSAAPASATVVAKLGSKFVRWEAKSLRKLLEKDQSLNHSFMKLLNMDLAAKVARS